MEIVLIKIVAGGKLCVPDKIIMILAKNVPRKLRYIKTLKVITHYNLSPSPFFGELFDFRASARVSFSWNRRHKHKM